MIKSLTSLRGIFILFIFFHHCLHLYPGGGSLAVAFFFVLGGFCMTLGYKEIVLRGVFNYKHYIVKRCFKFFPLHWLCLLASLPVIVFSLSKKSLVLFGLNAALLHSLVPLRDVYYSFNAVSWYLANTLIFQALFPSIIRILSRAAMRDKVYIFSIVIIVYVLVVLLLPNKWHHALLYINPVVRITDFMYGIFLALGYLALKGNQNILQKVRKYKKWFDLVLVLCVAGLVIESCYVSETTRLLAPIYWPMIGVLLFISSLGGGKIWGIMPLQFLGKVSFSFYLTHQLVISYVNKLFKFFAIDATGHVVLFIIATLFITIAVSWFIEQYMQKPINKWLTTRNQPSTTALS